MPEQLWVRQTPNGRYAFLERTNELENVWRTKTWAIQESAGKFQFGPDIGLEGQVAKTWFTDSTEKPMDFQEDYGLYEPMTFDAAEALAIRLWQERYPSAPVHRSPGPVSDRIFGYPTASK